MPELEIDLPGAPSIRFEGQELDTDRRKAIAFLANLVVIGEEDS